MRKVALATLIGLAVGLSLAPPAEAAPRPLPPILDKLVTLKAVKEHLKNFEKIADANAGTRAAGSPGNDASIKYVVQQLRWAGYQPKLQAVEIPYYQERSPSVLEQKAPTPTTYTHKTDYLTMTYSGNGDATAKVTAVDPAGDGRGSGCDIEDFKDFPKGHIALVKRGNPDFNCQYFEKAVNAEKSGAVAVVVYNDALTPDRTGVIDGSLLSPATKLPVLGIAHKLGTELVAASQAPAGLTLRVKTDTVSEQRTTYNVTADTWQGRADKVVVIGAHLDSVPAGPGINDNASGSSAVLAIAQRAQLLPLIKNKVRFAFWAAEERGSIGSRHYVKNLSEADRAKVALNLNFDMLGSTNYVRFVHDGDGSLRPDRPKPPAGSDTIEKEFGGYFTDRGLKIDEAPFDGRSDYVAFTEYGIPAGGMHSGYTGRKTPAQVETYGGTADELYDPCYHQACDRTTNIDDTVIDQLTDGAAALTQRFAYSLDGIPARTPTPAPALRSAPAPTDPSGS